MKVNDLEAVERWVRLFTPPTHREEVLGDLSERTTSPNEYLREALTTVPYVVASRIRRTTHPLGALLVGAFLYWGAFWANMQAHWLSALLPTLLVLASYALCDAYRDPAALARWKFTQARDMAIAALAVLALQALLRALESPLALTLPSLFIGFPFGLALLYCGRLQGLPGIHQPSGFERHLSEVDLRCEITLYESLVRRAVRIELGACCVVALVFLAYMVWLPGNSTTGRIGQGITVLGASFVAAFLWRHVRVRPIPDGLGFDATLQAYRSDLERRAEIGRMYPLWYLLPVMTGPAVWIVSRSLERPGGWLAAAIALAIIVAVGFILTLASRAGLTRIRKRLEQLRQVSETATDSA